MDDRLALIGIGVLGLGLSALAVVHLVRPPRRLRPNDDELRSEYEEGHKAYNAWIDKLCPSRKQCADARDAATGVEQECAAIQKDIREAKRIAEIALSDAKQYVHMDEYVVRTSMEDVKKAWERVRSEEWWLRELSKKYKQATSSVERRNVSDQISRQMEQIDRAKNDYDEFEEAAGMKLEMLGANEEAIAKAQEQLKKVERADPIKRASVNECLDRWERAYSATETACSAYKQCSKKYITFTEFLEKRRQREHRRELPDPLRMPMRAKETQFGVEMEVVFPPEDERAYPLRDIAYAVASVVGQEPGSRSLDNAGLQGDYVNWRDKRSREWKIVRDISLGEQGAEIVTPVLWLNDIADVQKVAQAVSRAGAFSSGALNAGLHVHVSHPTQTERIVPIAQAAVKLDASIPRHPHRGKEWAKPIPDEFGSQLQAGMTERDVLYHWYISQREPVPRGVQVKEHGRYGVGKQSQTRYTGVNLHALPYMGTFEVRAYDGTLDPDEIKRAILSAAKMVTTRMYKNRGRRRKRRAA